ncbi:amino acid adenylation domain-containing protein [Kitasatospora sp. NPDC048194]|uniref:amino acid adenylation domain-containing protein n=1 Tax=Kitasatospora sp. NPDC048194 TaxID=3364045 RepID=UPI00371F9C0D
MTDILDPVAVADGTELLSAADLSLIDGWNATGHHVPTATLPELVQASAAAHPDRPAVRHRGTRLSYAELNERANRLARLLIRGGARRGDIVAMVLPRSVDYIVGALAVVKTGAAYLPVDTGYPVDRITQVLADARPAQVLTTTALADSVHSEARLLVLDEESTLRELAQADPTDPTDADRPLPLTPDNPAYVLYTSGSTGRPKGVVVAHKAITNRLHHMQSEIPLGAGDRLLQKTPAGFDVTVREVFWPLIAGAEIVVADPDGHRDPAYLVETITAESITVCHFVPSGLKVFLQEPEAAGCTSLRHVVCGGEALPAELQAWFASVLEARLLNVYGPTEAAVDVTSMFCPRNPEPGPVLIGRPVWNTRLYVLDEQRRQVPPGVLGELYLAGVQLAEGYLGRPDLTAERFVEDPFVPGERMYRTGDLARWRADGMMEFFGRIDHQVKIRGFRVELDEIESAVLREPEVAQAAVIVREDVPGDQRLVAYLVPAAGVVPDVRRLRERLARELPDYMVPTAFVGLDRLPLTPNEKLDRTALPRPGRAAVRTGRAPRGEAEQLLVELFARFLDLPEDGIGVADDFFALGGNSLLAAQVLGEIRKSTGVRLRLNQAFRTPTVEALAAQLA